MNGFSKIVISILLVFVSTVAYAQTKRALIIGLGQQEDSDWTKINGDKDIPYVEEILNGAGFKQITKLVNKQATKDSISAAFEHLAASCKTGDIVYVHYSGHGQQMTDLNNDEADGLDECWIPYDAYRKPCDKDRGEKHLTDDEVNKYLNAGRDKVGDRGKILVVIDACHSGDSTRNFGEDTNVVRGVGDIFEAIMSFFGKPDDDEKEPVVNPKAVPNPERWITISACQSFQMNSEMKKPVVGKLTYAFYSEIKENPTGSNEEFFNRLISFIHKNSQNNIQRPVLSGEINSFNITDIFR
ncbi:MAG: caspase family protein [Prevotella sp.]|nr:caspase family protein [Prevotella sp.]